MKQPRGKRLVVDVTQTCNILSGTKQGFQKKHTKNRDSSPLREERVDDSVSQRIDGQLWDPLEIFPTADGRHDNSEQI